MSGAVDVQTPAFAELLARAVSDPGVISQAYSQFHQYSDRQSAARDGAVSRAWHSARTDGDVPEVEGTGPVRPQGREGAHALSADHDQANG